MEDFVDTDAPMKPIRVNEINGLWAFLMNVDWSEPWFSGLAIFHVTCAILTVLTRNTGPLQAAYFGALVLLVFLAEYINEWAAEHWNMFARQQYFDSNGLFISLVFSMPMLMNCLVIVVSWLWDVGLLITNVKELKYRRRTPAVAEPMQPDIDEKDEETEGQTELLENKKDK